MENRILVTGGAGFIGSHLVKGLLGEAKWDVVVVDDFNDFYSPEIKRRNISEFAGVPNFELFETDICDRIGLESVFASGDFSAIVHLAARAGVRPSLEQPHLYAETNINGTLNLLEFARKYSVPKIVFGSSSSVYGSRSDVPFSESEDISRPISPYAATKIAGEVLCHTYSHLYGIAAICLRFFTVYGASQRPDLAIHKFARLIEEGRPIPVFGDGSTKRDYTYIDDIIQGVRAAIDYRDSEFDTFNLGESQTIELRTLISLLEENLGKKAIIERLPPQPGDVPMTCADISKAREKLGYNPVTQFEDGIRKFVEWFRTTPRNSAEPVG